MEQLPDSGYIVNALYDAGGPFPKSWLMRLNAQGDTLWTQLLSAGVGGTNLSSNCMATINNSIYGIAGYFHPQPITHLSAYFMGCLSNGVKVANKIYDYSPLQTEGYAIDKTLTNGFVIAGVHATSNMTSDFYLIRTNSFGDTLWTRTYNYFASEQAMDVKSTADSGFIMAGFTYDNSVFAYNIYIIKTDANGNKIWGKQYHKNVEEIAQSILPLNDGYMVCGYTKGSITLGYDVYLIRTDLNGDTLWTRKYGTNNNQIGYFVRNTSDGGFIISGITQNSPLGAYIIKTDSLGNVNNGTGIAEVNNPFAFTIYPNPSSGMFTVHLKNTPGHQPAMLHVYNVQQQLVYSAKINNNSCTTLPLQNLPSGMYMAVLKTSNSVCTQKIIIQH